MNGLNSILLEGNLTRDPEVRSTASGSIVCSFSIASNRSFKKGDEWENEVSFFDIEVWGKLAENIGTYCKKGRGVRVVGRLKQERWTDADGKSRSKTKIISEHVEFKPEKTQEGTQNASDGETHGKPAQNATAARQSAQATDSAEYVNNESDLDIPF
jgi:single-strand DNA-binding protein